MGARTRVHDRMPVALLELVVVPGRALGPLVLRVADQRRRPAERLLRSRGVEDELDHLPVALVLVVPLVERVVEPVLERELPLLPDDVRVGRGRLARRDPVEPLLVAAAGVERVSGEVEPVVAVLPVQVGGRRRLLHDRAVRPEQHDIGLPEHRLHRHGPVRLTGARARLVLLEPDDRRVLLGEFLLSAVCGGRPRE